MIENSISISNELPKFKQIIDRLLYVAKVTVNADAAAVLMTQDGVKHCIAESGLASGIVTVPWQWKELPFKPTEMFIEQNPTNLNISRLLAATTGQSTVGLFIRLPLLVTEKYELALQLYSREGKTVPGTSEVNLLKQIATAISEELHGTAEMLANKGSLVSITSTTNEVLQEVKTGNNLRILLYSDFRIAAVSGPLAALLNKTSSELTGEKYFQVIQRSAEPLSHLFRKVLDTSLSSPIVQIITESEGIQRSYSLRASPFRPSNSSSDMLDVQYWEGKPTTENIQALASPDDSFHESYSDESDPAGQFLLDTLLVKRSLRLRNDTTYLTVRAWRNSIRQHQIKALRAVKKIILPDFVRLVGRECATEIHRLVGVNSFQYIVPIPCGHSPEKSCLSSAIAKAVGVELGLPVIHAFPHLKLTGSSHPKENLRRAKMRQVQTVPGPAILIDDVATSGVHLGEASDLLKESGTPTFAIAWLGGNATANGE